MYEQLQDPVREAIKARGATPSLDAIRKLFPPTQGDPAFDPVVIKGNLERLVTTPEVNTGHAFLDQVVKTGLAFIDATFQGDHPKYGVKHYGENRHDGFPPTIVATIDALSAWGLHDRAKQLFNYWLATFVRPDGTIDYYGPALSEYGQILHTAALLYERSGDGAWWTQARLSLPPMVNYLVELCSQAEMQNDLVPGVPEADISIADPNNVSDDAHCERNRYFHNNLWLARGLKRWAALAYRCDLNPGRASVVDLRRLAAGLSVRTLSAIEATWPCALNDWWLPSQVESSPRPQSLNDGLQASYTNYRYWPEMLSSGELPVALANRIVEARLTGGGQFCGMTRFNGHLDDWPLADYLMGVWQLGRKDDFLMSLYGHIAYHQAADHLTAFEQVTLPPGREMSAPYCLPCQLVATRVARFLVPPAP